MLTAYDVTEQVACTPFHSLCRGRRRRDGLPVLIKRPLRDPASASDRERLRRELALLEDLPAPGVVRPRELLEHGGGAALVLEDPGGLPLANLLASGPLTLERSLRVAIRLASTLGELHRRQIVHRQINPSLILLATESDEPILLDFDLCARSSGEAAAPLPAEHVRASLPYLSPEQTGRMHRGADYRSDFYSLGVVLYELLTGRVPHRSSDALELIHGHIARLPPAPHELLPELPAPVSSIVMKLLAKSGEDRYQSAFGLRSDLERCLRDWTERRAVPAFELGAFDVADRFVVPHKLYGREHEVRALTRVFESACDGRSALCLVSGYAGIGKTSLIQELHAPIAHRGGYFIAGKFDQVMRDVPFGALLQALRDLVRQLLGESDERLQTWRERLRETLGGNGGVLSEVLPEIERVIGPQPAPPALGATEALNRFQLVFQNFLALFARPEHPLVLFLDDLQWADAATLDLLPPLLGRAEIPGLLVIGAYRDHEVEAGHPLQLCQQRIEARGGQLARLSLEPLSLAALTELVRDSLRAELADAEPLARLVLEKTAGNPFFVTQFLKMLIEEGWLAFDYHGCRWQYRATEVGAAAMTDNVIDLMARKIARLAPRTQAALTLAACVGNPFDVTTLAIAGEQTAESVERDLEEAIREGLLLPLDSGYETPGRSLLEPRAPSRYAWLHDRVQQSAYALLPDTRRSTLHLGVGRLLLRHAQFEPGENELFDITQHLNLGSELMTDPEERRALARLNLRAGRKARASTASQAALGFFRAGSALLSEGAWASEYELCFALALEVAEGHYRLGHFAQAEGRFEALLGVARDDLDKARVHRLRMVQLENLARYADALAVARESLAPFGVILPADGPGKAAALEREIDAIQTTLARGSIAALVDLPTMTEPEQRMVMAILTDIWSPVYIQGDALLARLISATMVRLSLDHGNAPESAYGYVTHAITVGPIRGDYAAAYELGALALAVNERFGDVSRRAKIHQQFHAHVMLWRQPLERCIEHAREACRAGLESGDFLYAAYGASTESWPALVSARELGRFVADYTPSLALIERLNNRDFADALRLLLSWAQALRGETDAPTSFSSPSFDERRYIATHGDIPFFSLFHQALKLALCYLFDDRDGAVAALREARRLAHHLAGTIWPVLVDFWGGLADARALLGRSSTERSEVLAELEAARARLTTLAEQCAHNFRCPALLLSAELERAAGREHAALDLLEQASAYADEIQMPLYRALANELAGELWLARGQRRIAAVFLEHARGAYRAYGANAKVAALSRRHAGLLPAELAPGAEAPRQEPAAPGDSLDLDSVMKAARAIAGEIESEKLLTTLLRIALENAGAERGALVLEREGEPVVFAARAEPERGFVLAPPVALSDAVSVPRSVVNYVRRTLEPLVLGDALNDPRHQHDPYIARERPRSLLCVPVLHQGRPSGSLYLDNRAASGVFTPERSAMCRILAAQAAISLENARLYEDMRQEAERRREAEQTLRAIVEGTAAVTGGDFFASLVRHLAAALDVPYAFAACCAPPDRSRARTLAFWRSDRLAPEITYDIAGTPCQNVLAGQVCYYPDQIQQFFPADRDLVELGARSYLGVPLHDAMGQVIGHLAVLDHRPMPQAPPELSLLRIFAARAGAELERQQAEEELRAALGKVEQLQRRLQAENVYLQEEIRSEHHFDEIIGSAPALARVLEQVERVAPADSSVLIEGETGTGKELVARAIHSLSARAGRPLVKVNCGAISAGLVESELFGHVRGAFTGAHERRSGRFELADGGTLFLDEVGELPLDTQVKLLRVLQEGELEPVGSSKTVRVDVRIIAATNRRLESAVQSGRFRADLFYRLNVLPIVVPPLRERRSDIPALVRAFVLRFAKKLGKRAERVSDESLERLLAYHWPGNVRELQNVIERGVVLSQGSTLELGQDLFPVIAAGDVAADATAPASAPASSARPSLADDEPLPTLTAMQRQHILDALARTSGVIEGPRGAAKLLDLHPNTLRSRMKKLGLR
jgi:predicted ATPase/transcriptional regulator with GAF, ATPase, and Fis domain